MMRFMCCLLVLVCNHTVRGADLPEGWLQEWETALASAKETEKPLFAVFSAKWCGPCQSMVANIYPKDEVREKLREWVPVYIDVDDNPKLAAEFHANQLPTLIYLNPDASEVNRTVGAVKTAEQMIELLETKGGATFQGGATSLAVQGKISQISDQIKSEPNNVEFRTSRFSLILDQAIYKVTEENLTLAFDDYRVISRLDPNSGIKLQEDLMYLQTLMMVERSPQNRTQYLEQFESQYPASQRLSSIWVVLAKEAMKAADYQTTAMLMQKYLSRTPEGEYVDEFELLLPQIEGFLELSKGVSFE